MAFKLLAVVFLVKKIKTAPGTAWSKVSGRCLSAGKGGRITFMQWIKVVIEEQRGRIAMEETNRACKLELPSIII